MALIDCPECRASISTLARACPHCGRPAEDGVASADPARASASAETGAHRGDRTSISINGFTKRQREKELQKKRTQLAKRGWVFIEYSDGFGRGTAFFVVPPADRVGPLLVKAKEVGLGLLGLALLGVILAAIFDNSPNSPVIDRDGPVVGRICEITPDGLPFVAIVSSVDALDRFTKWVTGVREYLLQHPEASGPAQVDHTYLAGVVTATAMGMGKDWVTFDKLAHVRIERPAEMLDDRWIVTVIDGAGTANVGFTGTLVYGKTSNCQDRQERGADTSVSPAERPGRVATEPGLSHMSLGSLENAEYRGLVSGKRVRLENGKWRDGDDSVEIAPVQVAYGDLDGDGKEEAAVITRTSGGGSGSFYSVEIMSDANGVPRCMASIELGDRPIVHSVRLDRRQVVIDITTHGPDDPQCCPTQRETLEYTLDITRDGVWQLALHR